jgi:hypothetical protein
MSPCPRLADPGSQPKGLWPVKLAQWLTQGAAKGVIERKHGSLERLAWPLAVF